ncbi:MAG TPA: ABC transporter ATP-binding protein [Proteobacteria bacterium]|nr:ABC transporter ATP-binding protein [Pseudomonadota bacterium]
MIRLENVTKKYGSKIAVDGVSFSIKEGSIITLIGPSGCGKTTTLRLIAGLERPDSGKVYLNGKPASSPRKILDPCKRNIGMVFQDLALWPHMTIRQNVAFPLNGTKADSHERAAQADEMLRTVNLHGREKQYPRELSGGEQQRVALARALVLKPRILLFDEPLANLDSLLKREIIDMLLELHRKLQFTLVYVTHNQEEFSRIADKVILMRSGRIEQEGALEQLKKEPRTDFVRRFLDVD